MILGITGTNGAGKGTVVDYLVNTKGFTHYSMRDLIVEEIERRGLEVSRPNMNLIGTALRKENVPDYFTRVFMERAKNDGKNNIVMESIRSVAEADNIKANGGFIIVVDAPREIRYERIVERKSITDRVSFEDFCIQEDKEMVPSDIQDPTQMNMKAVIESADYVLMNNGTFEELEKETEALFQELSSR